ncbi:MAG TPA: DUF3152 domain-containing protein [Propionibacteriaceae bacterium]|nr:DUF3152 domain-containing protein [Propionibacteriaceae bacterium]
MQSSGAGTLGTIAAILVFGLLGLGLRVVPSVVSGDLLAVAAASRDDVPMVESAVPTPTPDRTVGPTPSARPTAEPTAKPKPTAPKITVPATGPGRYRPAEVDIRSASSGGRLIRYDVKVEENLDIEPDEAARMIAGVLNDKRSWRGSGRVRFELVSGDSDRAELHAYIVTPGTTDRLCAPLATRGEVSCQNGNRVVLNAKRWQLGAKAYGRDVTNYRRYLVNHEFGHYIGHGHVECPGRGRLAPIMLQQTKGLDGCRKNPWVESG